MEDFSVDLNMKKKEAGTLDMQVSAICEKNGQKLAYVTFSDGDRKAEGEIPACRISASEGFSPEEISKLEEYLKNNLDMLKSMAKSINPIKAFMGK